MSHFVNGGTNLCLVAHCDVGMWDRIGGVAAGVGRMCRAAHCNVPRGTSQFGRTVTAREGLRDNSLCDGAGLAAIFSGFCAAPLGARAAVGAAARREPRPPNGVLVKRPSGSGSASFVR